MSLVLDALAASLDTAGMTCVKVGATVVQWNRLCFGGVGITKRTGSNLGHCLSGPHCLNKKKVSDCSMRPT